MNNNECSYYTHINTDKLFSWLKKVLKKEYHATLEGQEALQWLRAVERHITHEDNNVYYQVGFPCTISGDYEKFRFSIKRDVDTEIITYHQAYEIS